MKKIIFISAIVLIVLYIYLITQDTKIYYLALGDDITIGRTNDINTIYSFTNDITKVLEKNNLHEKTITKFASSNYRTVDIYNDIKNNKKIINDGKTLTIKNAIIKADFITISIGTNDFINYINDYYILKDNIINLKNDMKILIKELRSISKEKIILIGIYNPKPEDDKLDRILIELNNLYSDIANEYNIYYLNIYNSIKKYQKTGDIYLNVDGYTFISNKLISYIESDIIKQEVVNGK